MRYEFYETRSRFPQEFVWTFRFRLRRGVEEFGTSLVSYAKGAGSNPAPATTPGSGVGVAIVSW